MINRIIGNIKHLITRNTGLFIMFVCVQLVAVSVIFFSYGVANHYNTKIGEVEGCERVIEISDGRIKSA